MLRWGILGTGFITHAMLGAIRDSDSSSVTMLCGRNEAALSDLSAQYSVTETTTDQTELFANPDVDVIYIALPNHLHRAATEAAMAAGKPVLCEKSLTTTMEDANALIASVQAANIFFAEGLMYLAHPVMQQLVTVLRDPSVGELRSVSGFYAADIWQVVNSAGGGTLYNLGCYPASLLHLVVQTMCGEETFANRSIAAHGNIGKDDTLQDASLSVRFDNGVFANLMSTDSHGMAHAFEIVTTKGTLRFATNPWLPVAGENHMIWQPYDGPARDIVVKTEHDAFYHQVKMVERALATGPKEAPRPSPRLSDSLEIMQFLTDWEAAALGKDIPQ
ncbi:Gfo/Idh/MocA family protein [Shimia sagamensis]|uniref:Predicted dehydrogenase n=1 Tax=Shimia sagamensis TaxID=1566352 RepID=A0ABY1NDK1_9RHOB|nr:Gfo/Idh/MocA family oxidoreductase [Shimia sagamensis]SMP06663.1 Predicted dehydrogenase [Shimia sagamensis]